MSTGGRNDRGMLMPLVLLLMVLVVFAGAAVTAVAVASWRSTLRVDADTEAANVLASAENIVTALATGDGRDPESACLLVHGLSPGDPCPTGAADWTDWMPLLPGVPGQPGGDGCVRSVLEGCWQARFARTTETVQVTGRTAPLTLPVWTIIIRAAARCDALPVDLAHAKEVCVTVTDETVLTAETAGLPTYPTLLYSGLLWPAAEAPDITDCAADPTTATVWCAIPERSRPPADTQAQVSATAVVDEGIFINDDPTFSCDPTDDYCTIVPGADPDQIRTQARTVAQSLPTKALADGACIANPATEPAVIEWTTWGPPPRPPGVPVRRTPTALPADIPPAGDPQMVVSTGNVTITDNIAAPDNAPLLIVSGCHIIIDGPCTFGALDPADPDSAPQACDGSALDPAIYDLNLGQRVPVTLTNVLIVAAGGVWAADLQPVGCAYDSTAPALTIVGSVITGHAGATSLLTDLQDCDPAMPPGTKVIVGGYERLSSLPADTEAWATASVAWWPGRQQGIWRRR